jgi:hypothetical protein
MLRSRERSQRVEDEEHNSELREPHTTRTIPSKPRTLGMPPILVSSPIGHKGSSELFCDNSLIAGILGWLLTQIRAF